MKGILSTDTKYRNKIFDYFGFSDNTRPLSQSEDRGDREEERFAGESGNQEVSGTSGHVELYELGRS